MYRVISLLLLLTLCSCGSPSHYQVESINAHIYYLDTTHRSGIDVLIDCPEAPASNHQKQVIGLAADLSFHPSSTGTFEPGILGITDSVLRVELYRVTKQHKQKLALKQVDLNRYLLLDCDGELLDSPLLDNRHLHYRVGIRKHRNGYGQDTLIFQNAFHDELPYSSYAEVLNNNNFLSQMNYYFLLDNNSIQAGDSIDVSIVWQDHIPDM